MKIRPIGAEFVPSSDGKATDGHDGANNLLLLLQSALQPLWVLACSTIVEYSQHECFTECRCQRHVKPPTWRTSDFRTFQLSPQGVPSV